MTSYLNELRIVSNLVETYEEEAENMVDLKAKRKMAEEIREILECQRMGVPECKILEALDYPEGEVRFVLLKMWEHGEIYPIEPVGGKRRWALL